METVKKNVKPIAIAAGVTAGILGLYLLYKRSSSKRFNAKILTKKEKEEMISKIKVTYNGSILSIDTIIEIYEAISTIAVSETLVDKFEFQKARRKHRNNFAQYIKICEENIYQSDARFIKWEKEVLRRFGITEIFLENSVRQYRYLNNKKIQDLEAKLQLDRGNVNESKKALSLDTFMILAKRLTELFELEASIASSTKSMIKHPENVSTIINFRVYDVIYDEFGLKDEDIVAAITTYRLTLQTKDPELFKRFLKVSEIIMRL